MLHEMISEYLNNEYNFKPIQLVIVEHLGPYHAESQYACASVSVSEI